MGDDTVPRPYHWTVDEFYRAWDAGIFGHRPRVELIRGRILEHPGQTPLHAAVAGHIAGCLRPKVGDGFRAREHKPVHIARDTEPIADITVVASSLGDYSERHPRPPDVALLIEVADVSAAYDLGEKALLYAESRVFDYWVALPEAGLIRVHRGPTPNGYASVTDIGRDGVVAPLAAEQITLSVGNLLGLEVTPLAEGEA